MINMKNEILVLLNHTNTSYKYFFLLGCIDALLPGKKEYDFDELSKYMLADAFIYGDFVSNRYTKNDRLFDLMSYLLQKDTNFLIYKNANDLIRLIDENADDYTNKMLKQMVLYVPYRLIENCEIRNLLVHTRDFKKNKIIEELSNSIDTLYIIKDKRIIWRDKYYNYLICNGDYIKKSIAEKLQKKYKER